MHEMDQMQTLCDLLNPSYLRVFGRWQGRVTPSLLDLSRASIYLLWNHERKVTKLPAETKTKRKSVNMCKRIWHFFALMGMSLWLFGCPPTLYINNSFRQSVTVPLASGMVSLNRGESIELKEILKVEKVKPEKILVTRLYGSYFITAVGFQFVWKLTPAGREKASFTKIEVPGGKIDNPQFLHSESHNCITLVTGAAGAEKRWSIHPSGLVAGKCSDVSNN